MTFNTQRITVKGTVERIARISFKSRLSLVVAIMIVFTSFTAFSSSQSKEFTVADETEISTVVSGSTEAEDIVSDAGLTLGHNDVVSFGGDANDPNFISITRRCKITVSYHGEARQLIVVKESVGDVLDWLGIKPAANDTVTPAADQIISDGSVVTVDRIESKNVTSSKQVGYDEYLKLAKSAKISKLIAKTSNKIKVTTVSRETYTNGKKTAAEIVSRKFEEVAAKAASKTVSSAKKSAAVKGVYNPASAISPLKPKKDIAVDKNGVPVKYSKVYKGIASAYTGDEWTASGKRAGVGYIAVNPKVIPYGTKLYVRSTDGRYNYGYCIAADTGGFVNMGRIADLYFNSESECVTFGLRNVEIYVLS